jgi:hypothetical protein
VWFNLNAGYPSSPTRRKGGCWHASEKDNFFSLFLSVALARDTRFIENHLFVFKGSFSSTLVRGE